MHTQQRFPSLEKMKQYQNAAPFLVRTCIHFIPMRVEARTPPRSLSPTHPFPPPNNQLQEFTKQAFALLSEPLGLYIANERRGRLSEPNYPFGPGGEGGRDDAIYSSPTNLDGSQSGMGQVVRQEKKTAARG